MATFVQGGDAIEYVPSAAVASGEVVVQGELVGVARTPLEASKPASLAVCGIFDFPKQAGGGVAFVVGARVYWNATTNLAVAADGGGANKLIGKAVKAALDAEASVRVRLSQ